MANKDWNSRNHHPHQIDDVQIACRFCNQIFPNREAFIAHIDSHLQRDEVNVNNINNNNFQIRPKALPRDQAFQSNLLAAAAAMPSNNLHQQVNRNVLGARPIAPAAVNRNVFEPARPPVPAVNRNGFDALSLMQKVGRNDFNHLPLVQQGNNRINVANNTHDTFSWTGQPRPGPSPPPSSVAPPAPPPMRRNPSLLTYVPPSVPAAGSLQPAQLGFSSPSSTTRNNTRGGGNRQRPQKRKVEEMTETTTEQITRPFIDMLDKPIKKVEFVDLENMEDDDEAAGGPKKKLDLTLKL